jgi:putative phage-type endonuclease
MVQGSVEWMTARMGNLTGSRIYDACAKGKNGKYYATREALMTEKLIERLTGQWAEHYVSPAMEWGTMHEDQARAIYETNTGQLVTECAYFPHPTIAHSGASPDGLVGEDGIIEIKCPTTKTHIETLLADAIPEYHFYQMAWEIDSSGRMWADFVSYDPRLPGNLSYFCKRYVPEPAFLETLRGEVNLFLDELAELEAKVRAYRSDNAGIS